LKKEIQKNPQLAAKINETLSVNEDNVLAKMRKYFTNAINREFQAKGSSYKQPEERKEDVREYARWLENTENQNKLLERLKKDSEFGEELRLYFCLKSIKSLLPGGYDVSIEIRTEIKRLEKSSIVEEYLKNKKKSDGKKDKDAKKEETKSK
jgi:hypothetical protein